MSFSTQKALTCVQILYLQIPNIGDQRKELRMEIFANEYRLNCKINLKERIAFKDICTWVLKHKYEHIIHYSLCHVVAIFPLSHLSTHNFD